MSLQHNSPEYSVSEISGQLKRMVEETFGYVRVRGEISKASVNHASGHCYLALKDDKALLDAVIWKGTMSRLKHKPEAGMEVVATGKLTTYPGSSKYQLVIEAMEPAGIGALMAMLEARKKALESEGLFEAGRKKPIPFLPETIGIITSPTGAVIRDILHRLADRFPCHVLLWPVAVQGQGAAEQIAAAIDGFNRLETRGQWPAASGGGSTGKASSPGGRRLEEGGTTECVAIPSLASGLWPLAPDLIIVARGGGSIEDLWAFNEEIVVRAAANSRIPLISAVGHETDTTLIDFASDRRAPTPSAAAEMAVPVLHEWRSTIEDHGLRMTQLLRTHISHLTRHIEGLARGLPQPQQLVATMEQMLDSLSERLQHALPRSIEVKNQQLDSLLERLQPRLVYHHIEQWRSAMEDHGGRMAFAMRTQIMQLSSRIEGLTRGLPQPQQLVTTMVQRLQSIIDRLHASWPRNMEVKEQQLHSLLDRLQPRLLEHPRERMEARIQRLGELLESLNVLAVLKRGFALVKTADGLVIPSAKQVPEGAKLRLQFHDGERNAFSGEGSKKLPAKTPKTQPQGGLFD